MEESKMILDGSKKMRQHVIVVGAIHIGFGVLGLIGSVALFFALNFAKGFVTHDEVPTMILQFLSISLPLLVAFMSTLGLVGGLGLLGFRSWARYLVIVVAIIGLLNIPIGTLKGVYSLWVLFQAETVSLFDVNHG
jgi:hypothetical protein